MNKGYDRDEIDELMDDLTRPFYVLRLARAKLLMPRYKDLPQARRMVKSADLTAKKAKAEIREILARHIEG